MKNNIKKLRNPYKKIDKNILRVIFSDDIGEIKAWEVKLDKKSKLFQIFDDIEDNIWIYCQDKKKDIESLKKMFKTKYKRGNKRKYKD